MAKGWDKFQHSWFSSVDFLMYLFVALLFFSLGKTFSQIQAKMTEGKYKNGLGGDSGRKTIGKFKSQEPDEEKLSYADDSESQNR